jgi:putative ABC transport system permease protein
VVGAGLGAGAGLAAALTINAAGGLPIPPAPGLPRGSTGLVAIDAGGLAAAFVLTALSATLAALVPALRATRLRVIDALRA